MVGKPNIVQPPTLRDLTDPGEIQRLNQWLLEVWKVFNESYTDDIVVATTTSIEVKGGLIKGIT